MLSIILKLDNFFKSWEFEERTNYWLKLIPNCLNVKQSNIEVLYLLYGTNGLNLYCPYLVLSWGGGGSNKDSVCVM